MIHIKKIFINFFIYLIKMKNKFFIFTLIKILYSSMSIAPLNSKRNLYVGTAGDYKPVSFYDNNTKTYSGIDIEISKLFAKEKNYNLVFIKTSWPNLMQDTLLNKFDFAICGITKTEARLEKALMSIGYLKAGKTFLMRKEDVEKYKTISDVDKSTVRVIINPGGTNEKFANEFLTHANKTIHPINEEIPSLISKGIGDIMVTEVMEGLVYIKEFDNLAIPLYKTPFTNQDIGVLFNKKNTEIFNEFNPWLESKLNDGTIDKIKKEFIPEPEMN